jgi:hypothetical protein
MQKYTPECLEAYEKKVKNIKNYHAKTYERKEINILHHLLPWIFFEKKLTFRVVCKLGH